MLPDKLCVEGRIGGGLAAVEAGGEEVDVEEGHPQANHRRARPVQGDVLEVDFDKFSLFPKQLFGALHDRLRDTASCRTYLNLSS